MCDCVFFFKQKTAYEMRISDWSSDVCSSDLRGYVCKSSLNQWRARIYNPWILALWKRWHPWREFFARLPLNAIQLSIDQCAASSSMETRSSRSEEHTSELQSLMRISYAVFCLKKKNKTHKQTYILHSYFSHNENNKN